MKRNKIYQMVTDRIIDQLEKGVVPWKKSWKNIGGPPRNLISGYPYQGINRFLLAGFDNPYFLTFNQLKKIGGSVKKGEKATPVVFWKVGNYEVLDEESNEVIEKKSFLLRFYYIFSVTQCENVKHKRLEELEELRALPRQIKNIRAAEAIIKGFKDKPEIKHGKSEAYYSPREDYIGMPDRELFDTDEDYFSVLNHEMVHASGAEKRLHRFKQQEEENIFHKDSYGKEELVAEMGAGFLCGIAGIDHIENCASYLQSWIDTLKGDVTLLVKAGALAQKATDYILGIKPGE